MGEAYRVLSDDAARAEYDRQLEEGPAKPKAAPRRGAPEKTQSRPPGASAAGVDFQNIRDSFASFWGYDPKTKQVTDEGKLNTYVPKEKKKNPLDVSGMFEQFMGFKK